MGWTGWGLVLWWVKLLCKGEIVGKGKRDVDEGGGFLRVKYVFGLEWGFGVQDVRECGIVKVVCVVFWEGFWKVGVWKLGFDCWGVGESFLVG